jgi:hypothetical protein
MVVWEDGKMNKSAYRKFKVMTVLGVDDFASMREVVHRRYKRILESMKPSAETPGAPGPSHVGTGESNQSSPKAHSQTMKGTGSSAKGAGFTVKGTDFTMKGTGFSPYIN